MAPDGSLSREVFQSTLPVWGGTGYMMISMNKTLKVSIHPPRVGRDNYGKFASLASSVSIHPPRVGRDLFPYLRKHAGIGFNPPSPCGEGLKINPWTWLARSFNPPSPCGEGRREGPCCRRGSGFQSTLPVWGGTPPRARGGTDYPVSIHPPRVGRDRVYRVTKNNTGRFNPPSPCGEGRVQEGGG